MKKLITGRLLQMYKKILILSLLVLFFLSCKTERVRTQSDDRTMKITPILLVKDLGDYDPNFPSYDKALESLYKYEKTEMIVEMNTWEEGDFVFKEVISSEITTYIDEQDNKIVITNGIKVVDVIEKNKETKTYKKNFVKMKKEIQ